MFTHAAKYGLTAHIQKRELLQLQEVIKAYTIVMVQKGRAEFEIITNFVTS